MVFTSPSWVSKLRDPPDTVPIHEFMFDEKHGRYPLHKSKPPFTCGLTGVEYSASDVRDRVNNLAKALSKELDWQPNAGTEWEKVIGVFTVNTIDTLTLAWATHRLNGISSPANATYSADELAYQLQNSGSKVLFTCVPLLPIALEAASKSNIPRDRVFLISLPKEFTGKDNPSGYRTVDQLIEEGRGLPQLEELQWAEGQGARQVAFLCYSSGTSGLPVSYGLVANDILCYTSNWKQKGVMISHRNVIANVLQISTFEKPYRDMMKKNSVSNADFLEITLGLLPQSHIYSLVVICHSTGYRGDQVINLPRFEINTYLTAIQRFKINTLVLVPPIIILMTKNKALCDKFDLSSVKVVFTGAAPLGTETASVLHTQYPTWYIRQGYGKLPLKSWQDDKVITDQAVGLTETCTVACSTSYDDIDFGSSGSLLPGVEARLVTIEGTDIEGYDQPGELLLRSPSVTLGYLKNDIATRETFQDGWMRTGDEAVVRKSPKGNEHIWIVDRLKELIKVKGMQVAPAELEAHLLSHHAVADVAVIAIPDESAGERPKAFVVKSSSVGLEDNERMVVRDIKKHVEKNKARHKWVKEVEFIDAIPKSASGKILRRMLRDKEKDLRRTKGAKL
ncbi:hypothetical protein MMC18_001912 [Xylographa bjoerkii]|nr:hypothetical protein [Xylographa bjoerkii]